MLRLSLFLLLILTMSACSDQEYPVYIQNEIYQYCNTEPEPLVVHALSSDSEEYLSTFIDNDELVFVNVQDNLDTWVWKKTKERLNKVNRYFDEVPCKEDSTMLREVYSDKRFSIIDFEDEKNDQSFIIRTGGIIESIDGIPIRVLGELFEIRRSFNSQSIGYHIINYFITEGVRFESYPCAPGSKFYEEIEVQGLRLRNVLTMDIPSENDHYKVYFNKEKGIVLMEELGTGIFWKNSKIDFKP